MQMQWCFDLIIISFNKIVNKIKNDRVFRTQPLIFSEGITKLTINHSNRHLRALLAVKEIP